MLQVEMLDRGAGSFADHVQLALKGVLHDYVAAAANKELAYHRLFGAHGGRHRHV